MHSTATSHSTHGIDQRRHNTQGSKSPTFVDDSRIAQTPQWCRMVFITVQMDKTSALSECVTQSRWQTVPHHLEIAK